MNIFLRLSHWLKPAHGTHIDGQSWLMCFLYLIILTPPRCFVFQACSSNIEKFTQIWVNNTFTNLVTRKKLQLQRTDRASSEADRPPRVLDWQNVFWDRIIHDLFTRFHYTSISFTNWEVNEKHTQTQICLGSHLQDEHNFQSHGVGVTWTVAHVVPVLVTCRAREDVNNSLYMSSTPRLFCPNTRPSVIKNVNDIGLLIDRMCPRSRGSGAGRRTPSEIAEMFAWGGRREGLEEWSGSFVAREERY